MQKYYDVIIVGAGPAGSSCAKTLVKNGVQTLIIEKKQFPREKCCSGILSQRAIQIIQEIFGYPQNLIDGSVKLKLSKRGKNFIDIPWDSLIRVQSRQSFDQWLLQESNCQIFWGYYLKHVLKHSKFTVQVMDNNQNKLIFSCDYLIGADGGNSKVRKSIEPESNLEYTMCNRQEVYTGFCEKAKKDELYYILSRKVTDALAWFYIKKDNTIYFGSSFLLKNKSNHYIHHLKELLKHEFDLKLERKIKTISSMSDIRTIEPDKYNFGTNHLLLIGEASGLLGFLGEGISHALYSGQYAANAIINQDLKSFYLKMEIEKNKVMQSYQTMKK